MLLIATKLFAKDFVWEQSKKKLNSNKTPTPNSKKRLKHTHTHTSEPERKNETPKRLFTIFLFVDKYG